VTHTWYVRKSGPHFRIIDFSRYNPDKSARCRVHSSIQQETNLHRYSTSSGRQVSEMSNTGRYRQRQIWRDAIHIMIQQKTILRDAVHSLIQQKKNLKRYNARYSKWHICKDGIQIKIQQVSEMLYTARYQYCTSKGTSADIPFNFQKRNYES
jgi:hypothetical protein